MVLDPTVTDVNTHYDRGAGDYRPYHEITGHLWNNGILELEVGYNCGDKNFHPMNTVKDEDP